MSVRSSASSWWACARLCSTCGIHCLGQICAALGHLRIMRDRLAQRPLPESAVIPDQSMTGQMLSEPRRAHARSGSSNTTPPPIRSPSSDGTPWCGRSATPPRPRQVFTGRLRHGAGRRQRARDRQPRPPRLRAGERRRPVRAHGGVDPASPLLDHHRSHGDGIVDVALEVPDVDRCVAHARAQGAVRAGRAARPHRRARHCAVARSRPMATPGTRWSTAPATPARTCRATSRCRAACRKAAVPGARPRRRQRGAGPDGRVGAVLPADHGLHEHGRVRR